LKEIEQLQFLNYLNSLKKKSELKFPSTGNLEQIVNLNNINNLSPQNNASPQYLSKKSSEKVNPKWHSKMDLPNPTKKTFSTPIMKIQFNNNYLSALNNNKIRNVGTPLPNSKLLLTMRDAPSRNFLTEEDNYKNFHNEYLDEIKNSIFPEDNLEKEDYIKKKVERKMFLKLFGNSSTEDKNHISNSFKYIKIISNSISRNNLNNNNTNKDLGVQTRKKNNTATSNNSLSQSNNTIFFNSINELNVNQFKTVKENEKDEFLKTLSSFPKIPTKTKINYIFENIQKNNSKKKLKNKILVKNLNNK